MARRVLVVDSSKTIRRVVEQTLSRAGFEVDLASDPEQARSRALAAPPDLMVVDSAIAPVDGRLVWDAIRDAPQLERVPVVLMSAQDAAHQNRFRGVAPLPKPFSPDALLAVTAQALARSAEASSTKSESPDGGGAEAIRERIFAQASEAHDHSPPKERAENALIANLAAIPLGDLLQLFLLQRQTGVLEVSVGDRTMTICLSEGAIDLALDTARRPELMLGTALRAEGALSDLDLDNLVEGTARPNELLGQRLVQLSLVSEEQLERALVRQTSELVYEALRWKEGTAKFMRGATRPEAQQAHLGLPIGGLLMEGMRRLDEWTLIDAKVPSFDHVVARSIDAGARLESGKLTPTQLRVFEALDGSRTPRDLVALLALSPFDVGKALLHLISTRLADVQ